MRYFWLTYIIALAITIAFIPMAMKKLFNGKANYPPATLQEPWVEMPDWRPTSTTVHLGQVSTTSAFTINKVNYNPLTQKTCYRFVNESICE